MILLCYSSKKAIRNAIGDTRNDETVQQHFGSNHVLHVASGLITMSRSQVHVFGMALEQAQGKTTIACGLVGKGDSGNWGRLIRELR